MKAFLKKVIVSRTFFTFSSVCQIWMGLAALYVLPGMTGTRGLTSWILGPIFVICGSMQLLQVVRRKLPQ